MTRSWRPERGTLVLVALAALLLAFVLVPFALFGDAVEAAFTLAGARAFLERCGPLAWLAGIGLLVADVALPIPSTVVMSALGLRYGALAGGAFASVGSVLAGYAAYGASRWLGRPIALRFAGESGLAKSDALFARHGGWLIAVSRWLPVLSEGAGCFAGLTRMSLSTFSIALVCGSVPMGFAFAAIGALGQTSPALAVALSAIAPPLAWAGAERWLRRA